METEPKEGVEELQNPRGLRAWADTQEELPEIVRRLIIAANVREITPDVISFEFCEGIDKWHIVLWGD